MVPLGYFLIAWLILLAIYAVLVLLTIMQMLRHGLPTPFTYISTFLFVAVIAAVVMGSGMYFLDADWDQRVDLLPQGINFFFTGKDTSGGDLPLDTPL